MELRIEEILNEKGLKKSFVAKQIGVDPNTLSRWIKGGNMTLANAVKLADVLGVKVDDLIKKGPSK